MKSLNFEFIRDTNPELADLAGFAELYAYSDPTSALVKLRLLAENVTAAFFEHCKIQRLPRANFLELLNNETFSTSVPSVIINKLHAVRTQGNRAAHGTGEVTSQNAIWILRESFDIARWFSLSVHSNKDVETLKFADPPQSRSDSKGAIKREKKEALQKLAAQEQQMQKLLEELEETRARAESAEMSAAERQELIAKTNSAADALKFDEATTRDLIIDQMLVQAGWKVAPGEESTEEVKKELEVNHQPTDSGKGKADYVLMDDDGKPLAVIEAKKTSVEASKGKQQAKIYADGLEKDHGQRPVIFYTNGYEIWLWDDAKGEVSRKVYGFYTKDSLQRCHFRNTNCKDLSTMAPKEEIVNRLYQREAISRVIEKFDAKRRTALIVQATGTGKTRVAIALCDLLVRANRVKRVLFLCDRRELRKQANNAFKEFMETSSRVYVSSRTSEDKDKLIYLATYPAMMKCYQNFDVGFFDLIISDESHRSIYNRYRELFLYFDALQLGLTATPVNKILQNTFKHFQCEENDPTFHYSYTDAIEDTPPYLADFRVTKHDTKFLREGISYENMSDEQKEQLEDQIEDAELVDYSKEQVSKAVFNKDTDRKILRNLMEKGIRVADDSHIGKTIIFARNHKHAVQLQALFDEMYPQYMQPKKEFCAVIDNYVERAEQLIDDFKGDGNNDNLHIAISVDMLDTGIDVPEIVNLVFAKPVKSYVKFWQMIGRGTRLCPDLFGPGKHKEYFQIFDHWGNFEWFGEARPEIEATPKKSLAQRIFETRMDVAAKAIEIQNVPAFDMAVDLIEKDVRALPEDSISVRDKMRQVKLVQQDGAIKKFDAGVVGTLRMEIAPLMQWRSLDGREDAYKFDLQIGKLQKALLEASSDFDDFKEDVKQSVGELPINLTQVAQKSKWLDKVKSSDFWEDTTVDSLDEVRRELRGIMHCRNKPKITKMQPLEIDVTDTDVQAEKQIVKLEGLDLAAYRKRVRDLLMNLIEESPVLQKIKSRRPVTPDELKELVAKVTTRDPELKVDELLAYFETDRLELALRQAVGLDAEAVSAHFDEFVTEHPGLKSNQLQFLQLIKKHIAQYGAIQVDSLYEAPFTQIHVEGVDGVFEDAVVDDLLQLIDNINGIAPDSQD